MGSTTISIGNGNPTYSSLFVEQIQDSLKNHGLAFEDISMNYYRDYYLKIFNTLEVTNGLLLQTGIDYHIRKNKNSRAVLRSTNEESEHIENLFVNRKSFAPPFIRISWTPPQQYYRYEGEAEDICSLRLSDL